MIYLDTSAALKAIVAEPETAAVRALFAGGRRLVSSRLSAVELHAVCDRRGIPSRYAEAVLARMGLVSLGDDVAARAVALHSGLRTLDALHLATALTLTGVLTGFVAYDRELVGAAQREGIAVLDL